MECTTLLEGIDAFCTSVRGAMEGPSLTTQQKVLQLVVDRIVVEDSRVIIEHVIPTGPVRLQTEHHTPGGPMLFPSSSRPEHDTYIRRHTRLQNLDSFLRKALEEVEI
jgi:hypothetical protein